MHSSERIRFLVVFAIGLFCVTKAQDDPYRLPPNYIVNHYDIDLTIPAETFTASSNNYSGYVEIQFQVTVNTTEVKLHSSYTYIELLTIQLDDTAALTSDRYSVNSTTNILTLDFPTQLTIGQNYVLKISFNAKLLASGAGFYKASYTDHNNEVQYIATTQFESTSARYAFPCFDEPRYKASFAYNLTYPSDMNALTNTASIANTTSSETNLTTTQFDVSPKMPVYLVAFIISKYTCSEGPLEGSSEYYHRVCSREDKEYARDFAMYLTPLVIDNLNTYTGINYSYSLPKLDQVAVSQKSGAMENWGLVLYSESGLLFDNTIQTNTNKQGIAAVIAHELAHQWFGNLVTCKWWSEIFLNEGFATLYEYYIADASLPHFEMVKQFVIRIQQSIMTTDGYLNVPALRSNASTPAQISAKFGSYSYYKGASVLRMVEHVLGRENFRLGIQKYLIDNEYEPVEPADLWTALENVTENVVPNFPGTSTLSEVIDNWINKGGYPVLNVSLVGTNIIISQQRFLYSGTDNENSSWYIPVSYSTAATDDNNEITTPRGWLTPTDDYVITGFSNSSDWIVINNQQTGFYRVNYDETLWENLAVALKQTNFSGIHVLNRAQIIQDSYMLCRAGLLTFGRALRNTEFLVSDTSYFTWYPAVSLYWYVLQKTGSITSLGAALTNHFSQLIAAAAESLPLTIVDEEDHIFTLNQVLVNTYACKFGNADCVAGAKTVFSTYKNTFERPNINTRSLIYCNAIRYSDNPSEDWNFLFEQYQNASVSQDTSAIWSALGCSTNATILRSFLARIFTNDSVITSSLYTSVFSSIYNANEAGVDLVLDYFIDNYQAIINRFAEVGVNVGGILTGLGSVFTRTDQIEKLQNFINTTNGLSTTVISSANSAISTALSNQNLLAAHWTSLYGYFEITEDTTTKTTTTTTSTTTTTTTTTSTTTTTTTAAPSTEDGEPGGASTLGPIGLMGVFVAALINVVYARF